jgi:hypothetical protein
MSTSRWLGEGRAARWPLCNRGNTKAGGAGLQMGEPQPLRRRDADSDREPLEVDVDARDSADTVPEPAPEQVPWAMLILRAAPEPARISGQDRPRRALIGCGRHSGLHEDHEYFRMRKQEHSNACVSAVDADRRRASVAVCTSPRAYCIRHRIQRACKSPSVHPERLLDCRQCHRRGAGGAG